MEATGVELFSVLTARNLLIPARATRAKEGHIAESIVRLLYENVFVMGPAHAT